MRFDDALRGRVARHLDRHPRGSVDARGLRAAAVAVALVDSDDVPRWATLAELDEPVIQIPIVGTRVHAPTGAIIYQFREVAVHGRATRVAHLQEPPFAWR